jgi:hypothetical protein
MTIASDERSLIAFDLAAKLDSITRPHIQRGRLAPDPAAYVTDGDAAKEKHN